MVTGDLFKNLLKGKTIAVGATVSFLISYSLFFGFLCDRQITGFKAYYPLVFILVWAAAFLLCVLLWALIDRINLKVSKKDEKAEEEIGAKKKITLFFVSAVLIFAAWVPCLLASWPGFFSYDASKEFVQIWYPEVPIWGRISIIHSALLLLCCKIGNKLFGDFNSGIALFSIIHMLLGAFVLAYETVFLYVLKRKKYIYFVSVCYFMFAPVIALFSGCSNSTIFGSLLSTLLMLRFYEIFCLDSLKEKSIARKIAGYAGFAILAILTCHIRSSFSFLFSLMTVYVIVKKIKKPQKIIYMAAVFVMIFAFNKGIVKIVNAENPPDSELFSIPVQQLANVYVKNGEAAFSEDESEVLFKYFAKGHFDFYCPWCADAIKLGLNDEEFEKRPGDFWKLWIKKGVRYPFEYLEAWNYLTYEAWYPFCVPDGYTRRNYIESDYTSDYFKVNLESPAELESKIPALYEAISRFSTETRIYKIPVIGQICTIGWQYLFLLFALGYLLHAKRKELRFINAANFAYFAMMLFAPLVLVRYHLLMFYLFPLTLASLFGNPADFEKGE